MIYAASWFCSTFGRSVVVPASKKSLTSNALAEAYEGTLVLVSVNSDLRYGASRQQIQDSIEEYGIAYQVGLDTDEATLMERFGVQGWPARFLIDEQGVFLMEPTEKRARLSLREVRQYLERR